MTCFSRINSRSMAPTVEAKRGSSTSTTPRSAKSSTLASRSSEPKAAVKAPRFSFQAPSISAAWIGSAVGFQYLGRSGRPNRVGSAARPLTAGPAHRRRMSVDARAAAIFPDAGIGFECLLGSAVAKRFQEMKQPLVARPRQAAVEEHRHGGGDDAAIGVVLDLIDRGIADAHRAVAAITFEIGRGPFVDAGGLHDAVDRTQLMV